MTEFIEYQRHRNKVFDRMSSGRISKKETIFLNVKAKTKFKNLQDYGRIVFLNM
jgi:hypothetical protein